MLWLSIQGLYGLGMFKKFVKKVIQHKSPLDAYRYHIDNVNEEVISGWAHKIGDGNYTATIEVRHNNVILFTTQADVAREDLKAAEIGSGQYGFSIDPTKIQPEQDVNTIDVFIDGLKANVKPLPLTLFATKHNESKQVIVSDELSAFSVSVSQELQRLTDEISSQNGNAVNVAIENIASLSVRVEVIEQILTKHFTSK